MRFEVDANVKRLQGTRERRGYQMGLPTLGGFLFGLPFVGIGIGAALVGFEVIPVKRGSINGPTWLMAAFGLSFLIGGLMVWGMTWRQFQVKRRVRQNEFRGEAAMKDYPWNRRGFKPARWKEFLQMLSGGIFLIIFLSLFNWWAFFSKEGPFMVKAITVLFDLVTVFVWAHIFILFGRAFKYGGSELCYDQFPYSVRDKTIYLRWKSPRGSFKAQRGKMTLRCIEEWFETRGSGDNQSTVMIHEQKWAGIWHLEQDKTFSHSETITLKFDLPSNGQPSKLTADKPIFWELEVHLERPGFDFKKTYLVPIY